MTDTIPKLREEIDRLRESARKLHRRCQEAEAALPDYRKIIAVPPDGDGVRFVQGNLGRALLAAMCSKLSAEVEQLKSTDIRLATVITDDGVLQETEIFGQLARRFVVLCNNEMDSAIRSKLIDLGWTPPPDQPKESP